MTSSIPRAEHRPSSPEAEEFRRVEPGIYFQMPEERYHGAFALSASGIKNLRVSTLDFWARSNMNPSYEDEDTDAKTIGRAYHKRIVEGKAAFHANYAPELDASEFPNALMTVDEIKVAIEECAAKPKGKRKADLIDQLLTLDPRAIVWDRLVDEHRAKHAGREFLSARIVERIEVSAAMIESHPQLKHAFTGGYPEVSIFWTDSEHEIPMKARLDRLKARAVVDLKTYENTIGMPVDRAIARAVASYKYHIQAALYLEAVQEAKALIRAGRVFGAVDKAFLESLLASPGHEFLFVFQQKGVAPIARGILLPPLTMDMARVELDDAKKTFADCLERYGTDPWVDVADIRTFDHTEIPAYIAE